MILYGLLYKKLTLKLLMCDFVLDYKTVCVDIYSGDVFVEDLMKHIPTIGGFNGMLKIPSGYTSLQQMVLGLG